MPFHVFPVAVMAHAGRCMSPLTSQYVAGGMRRLSMRHYRRILTGLVLFAAMVALRAPFCGQTIWSVDEGITVTAAQRILSGGVLYRDIADQRGPLVPYLESPILAVGGAWNNAAIHWTLAVLLGLATLGIWRIGTRLEGGPTGRAAAVAFVVLSFLLAGAEDTMAAHTEWFLLLFSVAGFWTFVAVREQPGFGRGIPVGVLFGLAVLAKQPALLDGLTMLVLVGLCLATQPRERRAGLIGLAAGSGVGLAAVLGCSIGYFAWHGALADLWYYAWTYNNTVYVPAVPLAARLATFGEPFVLAARNVPAALVLGSFGGLGMLAVAVNGLWRRSSSMRLLPWLALGWTASGIVAVTLSGRAFSHYSIQVIPGLSLACGWCVAAAWRWCAARGAGWRVAVAVALALCAVDTGLRAVHRFRTLAPSDGWWEESIEIVRRATRPEDRIFVWGFAPDCYLRARRLPATRFVYTTFLTGMVPWTDRDPLFDTSGRITPGSWAQLEADFRVHPPVIIADIGASRFQSKYPLHDQPILWRSITREYAELKIDGAEVTGFRLYRRLDPVAGETLPAAETGPATLTLGYSNHVHPVLELRVQVASGVTQLDLFANGVRFRALPVPSGIQRVTFGVRPEDLPGSNVAFVAVARSAAGLYCSNQVDITAAEVDWHAQHAPGPSIRFLDGALAPVGSETAGGPPVCRGQDPESWSTPAPARLVYERPGGMRSLSFTFGLDAAVYYDRPDMTASDGVDVVVDYVAATGASRRLFRRNLRPKTDYKDCGPQMAELQLPDDGPGQITFRISPGPDNDATRDWVYIRSMEAQAYGPPLDSAHGAIASERVCAHGEPVMTRDPNSRWIAHPPSEVTYAIPAHARRLRFDFGLEPASYDGSQAGRSDGVEVNAVVTLPDGSATTVFHRLIDPATTPADQGSQTAYIDLNNLSPARLTIRIGPGPQGNGSYDWSYIANLGLD